MSIEQYIAVYWDQLAYGLYSVGNTYFTLTRSYDFAMASSTSTTVHVSVPPVGNFK